MFYSQSLNSSTTFPLDWSVFRPITNYFEVSELLYDFIDCKLLWCQMLLLDWKKKRGSSMGDEKE
jgi:hypothetical protein